MHKSKNLVMLALAMLILCINAHGQLPVVKDFTAAIGGNRQIEKYLPLLENKRVAVLTNNSGIIGGTSLVDTLLKLKINVKKVLVPEHGFRGDVDAGEKVNSTRDQKTGLPIVSLYGKNKKPSPAQLADVDVLLYDIQDLGVRFYTYISTMTYAMEACAENKKTMIVLDRVNPNGFYIDGPLLKPEFKSFLGLHPVPIVYGMTCGEYAQMVNGEGWLNKGVKCDLTVIKVENYDRKCSYSLPVKPSPNIPDQRAILLYPGLGLFEGTIMSVARGTDYPFQMVGHPDYPDTNFSFIPQPNAVSKNPRYAGKRCYGIDLRQYAYDFSHSEQLPINFLLDMYNRFDNPNFFEATFNAHAGNSELQQMIRDRHPVPTIRHGWTEDLEKFKAIRKKYLLYPDLN